MIRAIEVGPHDAFVRNRHKFMFELTTSDGRRLILARRGGDQWSEGWHAPSDIAGQELTGVPLDAADAASLQPVIVELPRDVAAALADAILTDAHGTPAGDVRALRDDLTHERGRRDRLEDAMLGLVDRLVGRHES